MRLQYLIQQVYFEPTLIEPSAHAAICRLLESRLVTAALDDPNPEAAERKANVCGEAVDLPSMQVIDGIAHIPISGAIGQKIGDFAKWAGAVDVADIVKDIDEAEADPNVKGVLFDIDSPGGMVSGTPETAERIFAVQKPKVTFTDGMIASAAYWLASSTDAIYATQTSNIGSIGVLMPFVDRSRAMEAAGLKLDIIKSGKFKGMGYPGTSLTEDQRAHLQDRVNQIFGMFKGHVQAMRAGVPDSAMQGQTFMAGQAKANGLVDAIVRNKAEAVAKLLALTHKPTA